MQLALPCPAHRQCSQLELLPAATRARAPRIPTSAATSLQVLTPAASVKEAMSNVLASRRNKESAVEQGEADKVGTRVLVEDCHDFQQGRRRRQAASLHFAAWHARRSLPSG